jgi:hypothetical protein
MQRQFCKNGPGDIIRSISVDYEHIKFTVASRLLEDSQVCNAAVRFLPDVIQTQFSS